MNQKFIYPFLILKILTNLLSIGLSETDILFIHIFMPFIYLFLAHSGVSNLKLSLNYKL